MGKCFIGVVTPQQKTKGASPSAPPKVQSTRVDAQLVIIKFKDKITQFIWNKRKVPYSNKVRKDSLGGDFSANQLKKCTVTIFGNLHGANFNFSDLARIFLQLFKPFLKLEKYSDMEV